MFSFITDAQREQLIANGRASQSCADFDPFPIVKLFTPDAGATWLRAKLPGAFAMLAWVTRRLVT